MFGPAWRAFPISANDPSSGFFPKFSNFQIFTWVFCLCPPTNRPKTGGHIWGPSVFKARQTVSKSVSIGRPARPKYFCSLYTHDPKQVHGAFLFVPFGIFCFNMRSMPSRFFAKAVIATIVLIGFYTYSTDCAPLQHPLSLRMVLRIIGPKPRY